MSNIMTVNCPGCGQKLGVPGDHGTIHVTCHACRANWDWPQHRPGIHRPARNHLQSHVPDHRHHRLPGKRRHHRRWPAILPPLTVLSKLSRPHYQGRGDLLSILRESRSAQFPSYLGWRAPGSLITQTRCCCPIRIEGRPTDVSRYFLSIVIRIHLSDRDARLEQAFLQATDSIP